jgi:hypothetical protein
MLTLACFGLLSTGAFAMSPDESANSQGNTDLDTSQGNTHLDTQNTSSDARTQPPSGFGSGNSGMESDSQGQRMGMKSESGSQETESITGEILRVQGELYVVQDEMGKEVQLHVDHSTQTSGELKKGDRIEAEISTKRHAVSVKKSDKEGASKFGERN